MVVKVCAKKLACALCLQQIAEGRFDGDDAGVVTLHKADAVKKIVLLRCIDEALRLPGGMRHRFFGEDMFSGLEAFQRYIPRRRTRGAEDNGVNAGIVQDIPVIGDNISKAVCAPDVFGQRRSAFRNGFDPALRVFEQKGDMADLSHHSAAYDADADWFACHVGNLKLIETKR